MALAALVFFPSIALADVGGRLIHENTLYRLDNLGTFDLEVTPITTFDEIRPIKAAALLGDEWLLIGRPAGTVENDRLMRFAAETGTLLQSISLTLPDDVDRVVSLELDPIGRLLVIARSESNGTILGTLDPSNGVVTQSHSIDDRVSGLTVVDGDAYTLLETGPKSFLARIDVSTGVVDPWVELDTTSTIYGDLAFDDTDGLHIAAWGAFQIDPPIIDPAFWSFAPFDLAEPPAEITPSTSQFSELRGFLPVALEIRRGSSPIDVPLGRPTALALALGLLAASWLILRARPT